MKKTRSLLIALTSFSLLLGACSDDTATEDTSKSEKEQIAEEEQQESEDVLDEAKADDPNDKEAALKQAQSYSDNVYASEDNIRSMLTDVDQYSEEAVNYAIENVKADYQANAIKAAKNHIKFDKKMNEETLLEMLTSEYGDMFPEDLAQNAVDKVFSNTTNDTASTDNTDNTSDDSTKDTGDTSREFDAALESAQNYIDTLPMSKAKLLQQLTSEYGGQFPQDAAEYAVENVDADYMQEAVESANNYNETMPMSDAQLLQQLTSEYGEQFTQEEAQYALKHMDK